MAITGVTAADEPASTEALPSLPDNCIRRDDEGHFIGWLDHTHCVMSLRAEATAQWLDDRFGVEEEPQDASALVRLVGETVWDAETGVSTIPRLNARLRLPGLDRRFQLIITGEDDRQGEPVTGETPIERGSSLAVRWLAMVSERTRLDFDLGARSSPDLFARVRGVERIPLTWRSALRLEQRYVYALDDKGSALLAADVERLVDDNSVVRWLQSVRWRELEPEVGVRFHEGLYLAHQFPQQQSLHYGLETAGVSRPNWLRESWGPVLLYRRSWWRPWLFLELEPRRTWRRELGWKPVNSVAFRVEVRFGH